MMSRAQLANASGALGCHLVVVDEPALQIRTGFAEIALHGGDGHRKLFGNFLNRVAAEETQLDDATLPFVQSG